MLEKYYTVISNSLQHAVDLSVAAFQAPKFIIDHKLWKGFFDHVWVSLFSFIIAVLFSYILVNNFLDKNSANEAIPIEASLEENENTQEVKEDFSSNEANEYVQGSNVKGEEKLNAKIKKEGGVLFFSGGMKYLLLILLEVLIFHFAVKTYSILKGKSTVLKFNDFYKAEIRMITVMVQSLIKTGIGYLVLTVLLNIIGYEFLKSPLMFIVYSYFIGHAFLDNYNEQHALSISKSDKIIRKKFGASTALGMLGSVIMLIPVIGPLTAPLFCSVTATLYGYRNQIENVDIN